MTLNCRPRTTRADGVRGITGFSLRTKPGEGEAAGTIPATTDVLTEGFDGEWYLWNPRSGADRGFRKGLLGTETSIRVGVGSTA